MLKIAHWFFFCILSFHCLFSTVIVRFRGQLGNQLFQAATGLALSLDRGCQVAFPDFVRFKDPNWKANEEIVTNYHYFLSKVPNQTDDYRQLHIYNEPNNPGYYPIPFQNHMEIVGYFISEKYFAKHKKLIRQIFVPSQEIVNDLYIRHADIIQDPKTVAIHVRTGYPDYKGTGFNPTFYNAFMRPDMAFFKQAMDKFDDTYHFVIFSDHIGWCKKEFSKVNKKITYIEGQDHIHDFFLITLCKHVIIANSTFGWWAAYLNTNPQKRVICRLPFFGNKGEKPDVLCNTWEKIPSSYNIPFPKFK